MMDVSKNPREWREQAVSVTAVVPRKIANGRGSMQSIADREQNTREVGCACSVTSMGSLSGEGRGRESKRRQTMEEEEEGSRQSSSRAPELEKLLDRVLRRIREAAWQPGQGLVALQAELRQFLRQEARDRQDRGRLAPRW